MVGAALETLRRPDAPMFEVLSALAELDRDATGYRCVRLGVVSNVTVDLLSPYLRRHAYLAGLRLDVVNGSYDDLLGDIDRFCTQAVDILIVIPFFDNLQVSWESQLEAQDAIPHPSPMADYLARLELALTKANTLGTVLLAGAHLWNKPVVAGGDSVQATRLADFNTALNALADSHSNVRFLDVASIVAAIGTHQSFDARFYYRGKAPYTPVFLNELAERITLATRGFGSYFYKVLVLDCDNTLWGGILGEDGVQGIKLDPYAFPGNVFWTVQQQVLALERQGVLVCLCSKNNDNDVTQVLLEHSQMVVKSEHIVARRVNWDDKPSNIKALAGELNLGLDSFVFVDDSLFEIEAVREQLPMVRVFQVPARLTDYPAMMRNVASLFLAAGVHGESRNKTQQYRQLAQAAALQSQFSSQEDYLKSLQLTVHLRRNALDQVERIAELTNKSNQFNLTTHRMTPGDVSRAIADANATVYSFSVRDRLAEHGLTGVLITKYQDDVVLVDTFLMSCRVIGRGVEFSVWKTILTDAHSRGITVISASFVPSGKNGQVADFFDRLGLNRTSESSDGSRVYESRLDELRLADSNWVEVIND